MSCIDKEEFIIESILSHRGSFHNRRNLQFLVRWSGYTASDDTWEPLPALRHSISLHAYLRTVEHPELIPEAHRSTTQTNLSLEKTEVAEDEPLP